MNMQMMTGIRPWHVKAFLLLPLLGVSGLGGWIWGWEGAVIAPLAMALLFLLSIHLMLKFAFHSGIKAYRRGDFQTASRILMLALLPPLQKRYDKKGEALAALQASMMQAMMGKMGGDLGAMLGGMAPGNPTGVGRYGFMGATRPQKALNKGEIEILDADDLDD